MNIRNSNINTYASLDLIKFLIIIPGIYFHLLEFLNFDLFFLESFTLIKIILSYGRSFYFTGILATFCVFFPIGLSHKPLFNKKRIALILIGLILLSIIYHDDQSPFFKTEWNFYFFALSSLVLIFFFKKILSKNLLNLLFLLFSVVMLSISFWKFAPFISNEVVRIILIGDCHSSTFSYGEWPLLPWIFLPLLSVSYAKILSSNSFFQKISILEIILWMIAIVLFGIDHWGKYYHSAIDNYSCFIFTQEPIVFWAHFLPFLFFVRLNRVENLSYFFEKRFFYSIKKLSWIKNFGLTYLLSLIIISAISLIGSAENVSAQIQPYYFLILVPVVALSSELLSRFINSKFTS